MAINHTLSFLLAVYIVSVYANPSDLQRYVNYYSREAWGAKPATDVTLIDKPVPYIVIHHTAIPEACYSFKKCAASMRAMQTYHMGDLDWGDIGYNFCVGSEGSVYEGRGWDVVGIHAGRANNHSIGICLIGDWRYTSPPKLQLDATQALIHTGLFTGKIKVNYKLVGHQQVMATECPGTKLADIIKTWPQYSSTYP